MHDNGVPYDFEQSPPKLPLHHGGTRRFWSPLTVLRTPRREPMTVSPAALTVSIVQVRPLGQAPLSPYARIVAISGLSPIISVARFKS